MNNKHLIGKRIQLIRCTDPYTDIKADSRGKIRFVDDAGTIHVDWDNGSSLGLCYDAGDRWVVIG